MYIMEKRNDYCNHQLCECTYGIYSKYCVKSEMCVYLHIGNTKYTAYSIVFST